MDELVKALRHYIARDLVYLVAGGTVIATFLYGFPPTLDPKRWPTVLYLLTGGIAYVVGYVVQDICSVLRLVTTAPVPDPGRVTRLVYRLFMRTPWQPIDRDMRHLYQQQREWERASAEGHAPEYERTVMLMLIGTAGGPCGLISAVLLLIRRAQFTPSFDFAVAIGAAILGIALLILGRLKAAQMTQILTDDPPLR